MRQEGIDHNLQALQLTTGTDRLYGVYPQKQPDLYMQRVRIPGGRISWQQWQTIAQLQQQFTPDTPIHLTTRQDIEFHNLQLEDIVKIQQKLIEAGIFVYGACGDSLRNITVCSGCGLCENSRDVFSIAEAVKKHLQSHPSILNLPRKFKISFSGCTQNCAKPYLNDIGFVAISQDRFEVIVAGSLGPMPALGIKAYECLPVSDVFALCSAAIEMFVEYGDRANRRKARFRHLRERFGNAVFLSELDKRFQTIKSKMPQPQFNCLPESNSEFKLIHRLIIPDGDIDANQIFLLADLCRKNGVETRINFEHSIELYGFEPLNLPADLRRFEGECIIIACQGSRTCASGLIDCKYAASILRSTFAGRDKLRNIRINISGCPNNCAQSAAASIGLVGLKRDKQDCIQLYTGGGNGKNQKLAKKGEIEKLVNIVELINKTLNPNS